MPTYEYRCKSCGHEVEIFHSITAPPKRKCPECGKSALERLIGTGSAVLFKGSGFYQTDYRSESYKKAAEAEKKSTDTKADNSKTAKGSDKKDPSVRDKPAKDTPTKDPPAKAAGKADR